MRFISILFLGYLFISSTAQADLYVRPQAGAAIPLDGGDTSYSLGATVGYEWNRYFATEASYARLIASGNGSDGDLFKGIGVLSLPGEWVTPYVSGGVGEIHASLPGEDAWDPMILFGGGVTLTPVRFLSIGIGVSYAAVKNRGDFLEPVLTLGLSL